MRELLLSIVGGVIAIVVVVIGVPLGALGLRHVKREEWWMRLRRLLGGLFLAALLALGMAATVYAEDFYVQCGLWTWPFC